MCFIWDHVHCSHPTTVVCVASWHLFTCSLVLASKVERYLADSLHLKQHILRHPNHLVCSLQCHNAMYWVSGPSAQGIRLMYCCAVLCLQLDSALAIHHIAFECMVIKCPVCGRVCWNSDSCLGALLQRSRHDRQQHAGEYCRQSPVFANLFACLLDMSFEGWTS